MGVSSVSIIYSDNKKRGEGGEERGNGEHVAGFVRKKPKEQKRTFLKSLVECLALCLLPLHAKKGHAFYEGGRDPCWNLTSLRAVKSFNYLSGRTYESNRITSEKSKFAFWQIIFDQPNWISSFCFFIDCDLLFFRLFFND
jgi:hypothetical protein